MQFSTCCTINHIISVQISGQILLHILAFIRKETETWEDKFFYNYNLSFNIWKKVKDTLRFPNSFLLQNATSYGATIYPTLLNLICLSLIYPPPSLSKFCCLLRVGLHIPLDAWRNNFHYLTTTKSKLRIIATLQIYFVQLFCLYHKVEQTVHNC